MTTIWERIEMSDEERKAFIELTMALDSYFEYGTNLRFNRVWKALKRATKILQIQKSGWDYGYALKERHRRKSEQFAIKE